MSLIVCNIVLGTVHTCFCSWQFHTGNHCTHTHQGLHSLHKMTLYEVSDLSLWEHTYICSMQRTAWLSRMKRRTHAVLLTVTSPWKRGANIIHLYSFYYMHKYCSGWHRQKMLPSCRWGGTASFKCLRRWEFRSLVMSTCHIAAILPIVMICILFPIKW